MSILEQQKLNPHYASVAHGDSGAGVIRETKSYEFKNEKDDTRSTLLAVFHTAKNLRDYIENAEDNHLCGAIVTKLHENVIEWMKKIDREYNAIGIDQLS